jgi:DNA-binding LacI/PurR family transcriptional regulator
MQGMSGGMEDFGYDLMVLDARRSRLPNETFTQMFMRKGIRGAILRTTAQSRSTCETVGDEGFPCVVVADRFDNSNVNYVYSESRESSHDSVEHLLGLGHRRIAASTTPTTSIDWRAIGRR